MQAKTVSKRNDTKHSTNILIMLQSFTWEENSFFNPMIVDNRRAIFEIRRAFPTIKARTLNVSAPNRPNFNAAKASTGPMFFWRDLPLSNTFGGFNATPEINIMCHLVIYMYVINARYHRHYSFSIGFGTSCELCWVKYDKFIHVWV